MENSKMALAAPEVVSHPKKSHLKTSLQSSDTNPSCTESPAASSHSCDSCNSSSSPPNNTDETTGSDHYDESAESGTDSESYANVTAAQTVQSVDWATNASPRQLRTPSPAIYYPEAVSCNSSLPMNDGAPRSQEQNGKQTSPTATSMPSPNRSSTFYTSEDANIPSSRTFLPSPDRTVPPSVASSPQYIEDFIMAEFKTPESDAAPLNVDLLDLVTVCQPTEVNPYSETAERPDPDNQLISQFSMLDPQQTTEALDYLQSLWLVETSDNAQSFEVAGSSAGNGSRDSPEGPSSVDLDGVLADLNPFFEEDAMATDPDPNHLSMADGWPCGQESPSSESRTRSTYMHSPSGSTSTYPDSPGQTAACASASSPLGPPTPTPPTSMSIISDDELSALFSDNDPLFEPSVSMPSPPSAAPRPPVGQAYDVAGRVSGSVRPSHPTSVIPLSSSNGPASNPTFNPSPSARIGIPMSGSLDATAYLNQSTTVPSSPSVASAASVRLHPYAQTFGQDRRGRVRIHPEITRLFYHRLRTAVVDPDTGRVCCPYPTCDSTFKNVHCLRSHYKAQHLEVPPVLACTKCPATFTLIAGLQRHVENVHPSPDVVQLAAQCKMLFNRLTQLNASKRTRELVSHTGRPDMRLATPSSRPPLAAPLIPDAQMHNTAVVPQRHDNPLSISSNRTTRPLIQLAPR
ncbi:uncharacterized protein EV422DRAFT_538692 [Fimicolochytrium jonesii]|uniref:uncharacterized protein n=1 Tax=Fimicolochytrium jonesii TaxID=1396493 RepID=UPI0022FDD519|nr:uncharacterized protein EV422DRAFT_538692 [Fimicolochytrium jonesii]KAI8818089.1 hypothetical protein EV422DRAFT_538692 [Fimicolochytrium jonesii]